MIIQDQRLVSGCRLLTSDMLAALRRANELYGGFLGCDSIARLYKEINELYRKESSLLKIPLKKVYYDQDLRVFKFAE